MSPVPHIAYHAEARTGPNKDARRMLFSNFSPNALRKFVSHYQHEQGISEAALTTALKMFSHSKSTASGISYYRLRVDSSGKEIKEVRLSSLHTFVLRL